MSFHYSSQPRLPSLTGNALQYSMYGHVAKLAQAEKAGIEAAGGKADLYQYVHTSSNPARLFTPVSLLHDLRPMD